MIPSLVVLSKFKREQISTLSPGIPYYTWCYTKNIKNHLKKVQTQGKVDKEQVNKGTINETIEQGNNEWKSMFRWSTIPNKLLLVTKRTLCSIVHHRNHLKTCPLILASEDDIFMWLFIQAVLKQTHWKYSEFFHSQI